MAPSEVKGKASEKGLTRKEALLANGALFCWSLLVLALAPSALGTFPSLPLESKIY